MSWVQLKALEVEMPSVDAITFVRESKRPHAPRLDVIDWFSDAGWYEHTFVSSQSPDAKGLPTQARKLRIEPGPVV